MITFTIAVLCVEDLERSAAFYRDVLGQRVRRADSNHILFECGLELHLGDVLLGYTYGERRRPDGPWGRDNVAMHFRADDLDGAYARVSAVATPLHPIRMEPWGERFFRVLDPDGHIVEIAEAHPDPDRKAKEDG
jgi:catechol 2,3-dioxygenase-like lactoylglutathione lyase family enzyme